MFINIRKIIKQCLLKVDIIAFKFTCRKIRRYQITSIDRKVDKIAGDIFKDWVYLKTLH